MRKRAKKLIVISGVNVVEGGVLTVFNSIIEACERVLGPDWQILALVNRKSLYNSSRIHFVEFPNVKKSWFRRIKFEYFDSYFISKRLKPTIWFSSHDISANVCAEKKFVYCHNALCFTNINFRYLLFDYKVFLFAVFYSFLYRINILSNDAVFVQQEWIKESFRRISNHSNVQVAYPIHASAQNFTNSFTRNAKVGDVKQLLYPTFPRCFKNIEIIAEALIILEGTSEKSIPNVLVTFEFGDSKYGDYIINKYKNVTNLKFIGRKSVSELNQLYITSDALIFSSLIETWGLPISEAKNFSLPLILSDLPYSHEAAANYNSVVFYDPFDPNGLSKILLSLARGDLSIFSSCHFKNKHNVTCQNWDSLLTYVRDFTKS